MSASSVALGAVYWVRRQGSGLFTNDLFESGGYQDEEKRIALVKKGLELLRQPDAEDADYMLLRVIEKDEICRTGRSGLGF